MQPQQFMKKYFPSDSLEPMSCHLSTRPRVTHQTSPNQTPIDKRRIKTIFNHFRDKPARQEITVLVWIKLYPNQPETGMRKSYS
jgi:hypothetical protein